MMHLRPLVVLSMALLACNGEQRRLQAKASLLEREQASITGRVDEQRNTVRETNERLDAANRELTTYNTNVQSFIAAHHLAASCIRTGRSTWGENNAFAHDVSAATRLGAALCSVALLNAQFAAEVARVADQLSEADVRVRKLKEQIAATERELASDRSELEKRQASAREIGEEIADVRQQMDH